MDWRRPPEPTSAYGRELHLSGDQECDEQALDPPPASSSEAVDLREISRRLSVIVVAVDTGGPGPQRTSATARHPATGRPPSAAPGDPGWGTDPRAPTRSGHGGAARRRGQWVHRGAVPGRPPDRDSRRSARVPPPPRLAGTVRSPTPYPARSRTDRGGRRRPRRHPVRGQRGTGTARAAGLPDQDHGNPTLQGFRFSPGSIDVTGGSRTVTFTVAATDTGGPDAASGIRYGFVSLSSPDFARSAYGSLTKNPPEGGSPRSSSPAGPTAAPGR